MSTLESLHLPAGFEGRFWEKVNRNGPVPAHRPELGPCWLWTGSTNDKGYGKIGFHRHYVNHILYAHRISYLLAHGVLPDDREICHECDTPPCVRPDHLFAGTRRDNLVDMVQKGRDNKTSCWRGEAHYKAKLRDQQVRDIKARGLAGERPRDLAAEYGVSKRNVEHIIGRRTWKHIA
jgi:hypothetical protein